MRLTTFGIILASLTVFVLHSTAGRTDAQIPERILFQPGSYAYGTYRPAAPRPGFARTKKVLVEVPVQEDEIVENDTGKSDWEKDFGRVEAENVMKTRLVEIEVPDDEPVSVSASVTPPYLAYYRHPITHRVHVVPYQKGYPEGAEMPKHQSRLNLWLSSLPCREQDRPQVQYLGYYDPDPEILEDRPSRIDLILGYPNAQWTTCCDNRWGHRLAQCPGIERFADGPPAEGAISNQACDPYAPQGLFGGLFAGPRSINYHPYAYPYGAPMTYQGGMDHHGHHGHGHYHHGGGNAPSHAAPCPYCPSEGQDARPMVEAQPLPAKAAAATARNCVNNAPKKPSNTPPRCGKACCKSCAKKAEAKAETEKAKPAAAPPDGEFPLKSKSAKKIETEDIAKKQ